MNNGEKPAAEIVEKALSVLPDKLDLDNKDVVFYFADLNTRIDKLKRQAWIMLVDEWLDKAPEGLAFKMDPDTKSGINVDEDSVDAGGEDYEETLARLDELASMIDDIGVESESFLRDSIEGLNKVRWRKSQYLDVLVERAWSAGISDGAEWIESLHSERQRRALDAETKEAPDNTAKAIRL